ncbi:hypothetical protein U9M48_016007 [Paspalum notatum var. saurae]|uniref:peroxidase n=1 Tax=Paspalum notatum var. saurae TaxID=547442 RepID=A0AAQ3T5B5_PASNO
MATRLVGVLVLLALLGAATAQVPAYKAAAPAPSSPPVPPPPAAPTPPTLKVGYYARSCPRAEYIVRQAVRNATNVNPGLGAGLIRMAFHDCFVQGCDASVLLDPTPANPRPEKLGPPNFPSLRGFDVVDAAKAALEKACPGVVSCADVVQFAARDAASILSGGRVYYKLPAGRFDGRVSLDNETLAFLPPPSFNLSRLVANFQLKGLGVDDLVVLSGAHTVGRSHCSSFVSNRIDSTPPSDMNPALAAVLKSECPANPNFTNDPTVVQDVVTANRMDNQYYKNVLSHNVLFVSDAALLTSRQTAKKVAENAVVPNRWEAKFAKAMVKMSRLDIKTAANGEIRKNCRKMARLLGVLMMLVAMLGGATTAASPPPPTQTLTAGPPLRFGFYKNSCPRAEVIVREAVWNATTVNPGAGAGLIRMAFHDCFVQGCDASVLLDPTPANPRPEKLGPPNFPSLRGFEVIDAAKAALEQACPGTVSCADIVQFAARDAAFFLSGFRVNYRLPAGRLDGRVSLENETLAFLPPPSFDLSQLIGSFSAKGLSVDDLVVLSGAHTVGRSHCSSFVSDRLSSTPPSDINPGLAAVLKRQCPANPNFTDDPTVVQDVATPDRLDSQYYKNVLNHKVLFTSDAALLSSRHTATKVVQNAFIPGKWEKKFAKAMVRMAAIDVKTAAANGGEIRSNCRVEIVRGVVVKAVTQNPGIGAGLIRMLFHDCFVEGCDASVLLDPTTANPQPEKLAPPNNPSLRGFEVIDAAKAALEAACPGTVSCADVVAFAARDASAALSGGRADFAMPAGRRDGRASLASDALQSLPPPTFTLSQLAARFAAKGLDADDLVVLSGAHTVGASHCSSFVNGGRLNASASDMNPALAASLRQQCPASPNATDDPTVVQDVVTPNALDSQYYRNVLARNVLFTSDDELLKSSQTAAAVVLNAFVPGLWEQKFKAAMVKMAGIQVKTGTNDGEIRRNCRAIN